MWALKIFRHFINWMTVIASLCATTILAVFTNYNCFIAPRSIINQTQQTQIVYYVYNTCIQDIVAQTMFALGKQQEKPQATECVDIQSIKLSLLLILLTMLLAQVSTFAKQISPILFKNTEWQNFRELRVTGQSQKNAAMIYFSISAVLFFP